ncbi:hypothetical protein AYO38_11900 [bacterium SCGC AG-212-C10]|nr:hypothetical protein AYO38_11900 [bacterium SCGC AG-212-C10]
MTDVRQLAGQRLLVIGDDSPRIATVRDVTDLIGDCMGEEATAVAIPVGHIDASFFDLRSGFAGDVLQKMVNYGLKLAVIGDISGYVERSNAFRDLVREADRGGSVYFVADLAALEQRLMGAITPTR